MRKRKYIVKSIVILVLMLVMVGCGGRGKKNASSGGGQRRANRETTSASNSSGNTTTVEVVDLAGRTVDIPTGNVTVILGESRMIYAIAPLFGKNGNAFKHIIGWRDDLAKKDPDAYEVYLEKFPEISDIANTGSYYTGDFSVEKAISLNADIVILNLGVLFLAQEEGGIEKLEKAGIKTVFVDFRQRPAQDAIPSMLLLGQVFGKQAAASKFINFYLTEMQKVYSVVAQIKEEDKPLVFMERTANAGWAKAGEYRTWGSVNMGHFVELAGGKNYGTELLGMGSGSISAEQLLDMDPDVIIGTGGNWTKSKPDTGAVLLGYKATKDDVQKRLQAVASRLGWNTLKAAKNKRVYSIYHQFYNSPYHFIAIQQMAKWIYPDKFADLDPKKIFIELHDEFLPISYSGIFWAGLE